MKVISIATSLMLLILAGCSDASPSAEEPSAQERTITLNLDITTRADELLPDNSEPDIIRLWIFDNNNENLITYVVSSQNVWTPVGTDGIDIKTTLQTEIEAENIDVKQSLKIYLLLNQPYTDDSEGSTVPVDFSDIKTLGELKGKMFVLTEYKGDNKVPMTGKGTATFSSVEGNKIIFDASIDATRCVGKLEVYCTKNLESTKLSLNKITLGHEPNKGYLWETLSNSDITYNKERTLFELQNGQEITTVLTGEDLPDNDNLESEYEEGKFTNIPVSSPYLLENQNGGDALQVKGVDETITDEGYYLTLNYTLNGSSVEKKIYLTKIERNTLNKVFIRIKEKVFDIDVSYSVKDWEMEVLTPEF